MLPDVDVGQEQMKLRVVGIALVGCTDRYENFALDSTLPSMVRITGSPSTATGQQCFVKISYLLRF